MSLRTSYIGSFGSALVTAKTAGKTLITANSATITTEMTNAAAAGKSSFDVSLVATFQPDDLRLGGNLWEAFATGIEEQLAVEEIMRNEFSLELDTSDTMTLTVVISFSF